MPFSFSRKRLPSTIRFGYEPNVRVRYREGLEELAPCNIVIFVAHPDDELFATPGLIPYLQENGNSVLVVYTTIGENGRDRLERFEQYSADIVKIRYDELTEAHRNYESNRDPIVLGYFDGKTSMNSQDIQNDVQTILEKTRPKAVYTFGPDGISGHPDHVTIGKIVAQILRHNRDIELFQFASPIEWAEYLTDKPTPDTSVWYFTPQNSLPLTDVRPLGVSEKHIAITHGAYGAYASQFSTEAREGYQGAITTLPDTFVRLENVYA